MLHTQLKFTVTQSDLRLWQEMVLILSSEVTIVIGADRVFLVKHFVNQLFLRLLILRLFTTIHRTSLDMTHHAGPNSKFVKCKTCTRITLPYNVCSKTA